SPRRNPRAKLPERLGAAREILAEGVQPAPGLGRRTAVDRILHLLDPSRRDDHDRCLLMVSGAVRAPESLHQRVIAGDLGDQAIEVQVRARFDALRGDAYEGARTGRLSPEPVRTGPVGHL